MSPPKACNDGPTASGELSDKPIYDAWLSGRLRDGQLSVGKSAGEPAVLFLVSAGGRMLTQENSMAIHAGGFAPAIAMRIGDLVLALGPGVTQVALRTSVAQAGLRYHAVCDYRVSVNPALREFCAEPSYDKLLLIIRELGNVNREIIKMYRELCVVLDVPKKQRLGLVRLRRWLVACRKLE